VNGEESVRDLLGLDERASVVEIAAFALPGGGPGEEILEEEELLDLEGGAATTDELPEETLALLSMEENLTRDPDLEEFLPEGRAYRSDLDDRIVVLEGIASAVIDGPVHQISASCWALDARGAEPAMVLVGERDRGIVVWGRSGEVRVYSIAQR
jgi:hypothetical protein